MKLPKLRIAAELHAAPGWVPLVADSEVKAAYRTDVVMWISPQPNSLEVARLVVDAVNRLGNHSPYFGCQHCEASQIGADNFKHEVGCLADGIALEAAKTIETLGCSNPTQRRARIQVVIADAIHCASRALSSHHSNCAPTQGE